ncbi:MAG: hypothetical protein ACRC68_12990 [Clostridium sp.]
MSEIFKTYTLDYFSKYYFYEEDEFIKKYDDGEIILKELKVSNRFDYKGKSFTYTKFGNISEGITDKEVNISVEEDSINVKVNNEIVHLDLIYKFETKKLEDHIRIATRISEKSGSPSCLLYIDFKQCDEFLKALENVKDTQIKFKELK